MPVVRERSQQFSRICIPKHYVTKARSDQQLPVGRQHAARCSCRSRVFSTTDERHSPGSLDIPHFREVVARRKWSLIRRAFDAQLSLLGNAEDQRSFPARDQVARDQSVSVRRQRNPPAVKRKPQDRPAALRIPNHGCIAVGMVTIGATSRQETAVRAQENVRPVIFLNVFFREYAHELAVFQVPQRHARFLPPVSFERLLFVCDKAQVRRKRRLVPQPPRPGLKDFDAVGYLDQFLAAIHIPQTQASISIRRQHLPVCREPLP